MAKLLKIVLRTIGILLEWLLVLLILFMFAIRTSPFQTYLAKEATAFFSDEWNTKVDIQKVDIIFFDRVALDGVILLDQEKDTLAHLGSVELVLDKLNLSKRVIDIKDLTLKKGNVKIYRDKEKGEFNFQFISDYFKSEDTTAGKPYQVTLHTIRMQQVDFRYDDFRKEFTPYGLDYSHIKLHNLYLTASNFRILRSGGISTYVKHLSFWEKSGFDLRRFSAGIAFDKKGLRTKFLQLQTKKTKLNVAKLNLNVTSPDDFSDFVDKVEFDVDIKKSLVSLADVSLFATALEGMKDKVLLETKLKKRIKDLHIADLDLRIGRKTHLKGDFNLPDFADIEASFLNERIQYALIDIKDVQKIRMPKSSKDKYLKLDPSIQRLGQVRIQDFRLDGMFSNFVVKADNIKTALGTVEMDHGIMFVENKANKSFTFERSLHSVYDVKIDSFLLGKFIGNKDIGSLAGQFFLNGEIGSNGDFKLTKINGDLKRFDYLDYAYQGIKINEGTLINSVFDGKMKVSDDNLNLDFDGFVNFSTNQHFKFKIDFTKANLDNLNLSDANNTILKSRSIEVDIHGTNANNYSGSVNLKEFFYQEGDKSFDIPDLNIEMVRKELVDEFTVESSLGSATITGKVDYANIVYDINAQFSKVLPAIFKEPTGKRKKSKSKFDYNITINEVKDFLAIFVPDLKIESGTTVSGNFDSEKQDFSLNINSPKVVYDSMNIIGIDVKQVVNKNGLLANYKVNRFELNDSMFVERATFEAIGSQDEINSELRWNPDTPNETYFSWKTIVNDVNSYFFNLNPSYFTIRKHRWEIENNSQILLAPKDIQIQNFKMERGQQSLTIDGCISEKNEDILKVNVEDLQLEDFASLFGLSFNLKGELNAVATISDPFKDVAFSSDAMIRDFKIDDEEIGDINLRGAWGKKTESLDLSGELFYKKSKTFNFDGNYYLSKTENNLDFDLDFENTDIQFANVFMDPTLVTGIRGFIDGKLHVGGTPEVPVIEGGIDLLGGNAKVEMFGVNFGFNGSISADKEGFYINNMPVIDEEGNSGSLVGTVLHDQFTNWNMDLFFNLIDDAFAQRNGQYGQELDRFLLMDTQYKEGDIYYGKAYAKGTANIFGYADNLQIDVDMTTEEGTFINFPMYGASEIGENNFITYTQKGNLGEQEKHEIDFTGVSMNLNFKVTPEATLKVIFDPAIEDQIIAKGHGDFSIGISDLMDVSMNGEYKIAKGSFYNFVYPPVKEIFNIKEGGTITWTGDPVDAALNLETYNVVNTTMKEILPDLEEGKAAEPKNVECYILLTESLLSPLMKFDIRVPTANDGEKAALEAVKATSDGLNKQFFSLLLIKKFQPINGNITGGAGAALEIVSTQLEDALNSMQNDVRFNVGLRTGDDSDAASFGIEKAINDRLVIKTNIGLENSSSEGQTTSSFVGDVTVDYKINQDGTFRVSIFNESNDNTVIQEKNLGLFTQGAGLHYQEEFNNIHDFKMVQYLFDIFRKKKKYPIKKKRKQTKVPSLTQQPITKPDE